MSNSREDYYFSQSQDMEENNNNKISNNSEEEEHEEEWQEDDSKFTKESCHEVALKCKSYLTFLNRYPQHFEIAENNKWLMEITTHIDQRELEFLEECYCPYPECYVTTIRAR
jgi:predicted nucleic acid binding AN1-type Zn finger protein